MTEFVATVSLPGHPRGKAQPYEWTDRVRRWVEDGVLVVVGSDQVPLDEPDELAEFNSLVGVPSTPGEVLTVDPEPVVEEAPKPKRRRAAKPKPEVPLDEPVVEVPGEGADESDEAAPFEPGSFGVA